MRREFHVRFCEGGGVKFPSATRLVVMCRTRAAVEEDRLRGLLLERHGARLAAGRAEAWRRPFFEALGLCRLRGTVQYPGAA